MSRKKKAKSAPEKASTKASRQRKTTLETPRSIIDAVLNTPAGDLDQLGEALHAAIYAGGVDEIDYYRRLFDPRLKSLTDLPPALLDTKEALPPVDMIPNDPRALDTFLRRLVMIGGIKNDQTSRCSP